MQLFSEDYLMHYGVKGMKWKKRKGAVQETDTGTGERVADIQGAYDAHRKKMAENKNFERYDSYRYGAHNFQAKRSIRDRGGNYSTRDKQMQQMRRNWRAKKYTRDQATPEARAERQKRLNASKRRMQIGRIKRRVQGLIGR